MKAEQFVAKLQKIQEETISQVKKASTNEKLQELKENVFARKGELNQLLKSIKDINAEDRSTMGQKANEIKKEIEKYLEDSIKKQEDEKVKRLAKEEWIDVTAPGKKTKSGSIHPLTQVYNQTIDIFQKMGFEIHLPYEIDSDFHNFEAVNIPKNHPARDAWDTFWTEDEDILITHTSSMQNRILSSKEPPIRAVVPGKCFRNESTDARHEHTFYQVEGIYVDKGITLAHMLGTLKTYFSAFFEKNIEVKFMPDFFPFVEPGGQIALTCILCDGKGCKVCKNTGWLEVLGCGMIHPKVLERANIDPQTYTGFAWGFGLERLLMLKYNVPDIRLFHTADLRFSRQFNN